MGKSYKVTLGVLTVMILLVITVGTSYSYYSVSSEQTDPNTVATTCFEFELDDTSSTSVNLSAAYPMSDATAVSTLTPYEFVIRNTCTNGGDIKYDLTLNTLTTKAPTLTDTKIKYRLDVTAPSAIAGTNKMLNTIYSTDYDLPSEIKTSKSLDKVYKLESGTLAPGESKTYNFRLWLDSTADNSVMGKTFEGMILAYAYM